MPTLELPDKSITNIKRSLEVKSTFRSVKRRKTNVVKSRGRPYIEGSNKLSSSIHLKTNELNTAIKTEIFPVAKLSIKQEPDLLKEDSIAVKKESV